MFKILPQSQKGLGINDLQEELTVQCLSDFIVHHEGTLIGHSTWIKGTDTALLSIGLFFSYVKSRRWAAVLLQSLGWRKSLPAYLALSPSSSSILWNTHTHTQVRVCTLWLDGWFEEGVMSLLTSSAGCTLPSALICRGRRSWSDHNRTWVSTTDS